MVIRTKNVFDAMMALLVLLLAWLEITNCSVLVPTYVLPPASFGPRDQRSLSQNQGLRTLARLAGGHLRLNLNDPAKNAVDHSKNSFSFVDKETKNYEDKFAGVVVKTENQNVGWNQGQWDDGMLMSSAGNGKEKGKKKTADDDEDKKTLADQVAEGKYGLIQKELFSKTPARPGVISYTANPETKSKDNEESLGGLKKEEIWLAEDHLLVLKGGFYPDHGPKPGETPDTWPAIDAYQAPPRQVKIPQNPEVPPPFPVRLSDDGPLVFLTPNGSVPAPLFPARPPGAGFGSLPPPPYPYPPPFASPPQGAHQGNASAGGAPHPAAPFPFFPPGIGGEPPFQYPGPINASFPGGLPPGASFLPPPGNLTDLYDEDDPSIYYPPPYSFSYQADNTSKVPAGPLVPGIVLPPPPDFFAPLDAPTAKPVTTTKSPKSYLPPTEKPKVVDNANNVIDAISTQPPKVRPTYKHPSKVVIVSKPIPTRVSQVAKNNNNNNNEPNPVSVVSHKQVKTTLKPITNIIANPYYPQKNYYEENSVSQSPRPFLIYGPPERVQLNPYADKSYVTSTPVPLRAYYGSSEYENNIPKIQIIKQNLPTVTRVRPDFIQSTRQNGKSVASFYFYEEPATKITTPTPEVLDYYDGKNYYNPIKSNAQILQEELYNQAPENAYQNPSNLEFRPIPSREPSPFFFIPQRQGSRTLTQEYFSVQKPKAQNNYIQPIGIPEQNRPESFYDQIASIQQTIDYYTTHRPKVYQQNPHREARQKLKPSPRPVYQFSFQSNNARPEQNTFRAPEMDSEPFRPMVQYSKPYNVRDYQSTPKTIFSIGGQRDTTESPQPSKYYTTVKPDYDYDDGNQDKKNGAKFLNKPLGTIKSNYITSPKPKKVKLSNPTTKSPEHAYYTKQEEGYFDDITKNYFNIFGQKIEHSNADGVAVTAPIKHVEISTLPTPTDSRNNGQYQQPIISLASDTQVNFRQPRPLINPDSEFIPIVDPAIQAKYNADQLKRLQENKDHKPKVHNVEIIKSEAYEQGEEGQTFARDQIDIRPIAGRYNRDRKVPEGRPGSLVAYRLPGEGAHVYFLTPQPARTEYRAAESSIGLS